MMRPRPLHVGLLIGAAVASVAAAAPVHADGVHAVGRVRPIAPGPTVSIALLSGYGFTGDVLGDDDGHHRAQGAVAAAVRATPWLELGGQLAGRYDRHSGSTADDGLIGDPRLWATVGGGIGGGRALGLRLGVWLPGADAPSVELDAASVDAAAVFTWAPGATAVTASAGFRYDRSTASVDAARLSRADRLGLGLSDANAALLGVGIARRAGPWQLLGELSGDLLIGAGAPAAVESPWRVGAGLRRSLDRAFTIEAMIEVAVSARPDLAAMDPSVLVAVEPRLAIGFGVSWRPAPASPRIAVVPTPDLVVVVPPPPPPPTTGTIRGRLVDEQGAPLPAATVTIGSTTVQSGDDGSFEVADVLAGDVAVRSERAGYQPDQRTVAVVAGAGAQLDITLVRIKPPSQIRGVIRSFGGKGLGAVVRIEPLGLEVSAGADGRFSVDVPPGSYTVVITMPGFKSQRRPAKVEDEGVYLLNAELRKGKP